MPDHISSDFDRMLTHLDDTLLRMGGLGRDLLTKAAHGLFSRDNHACNAVIAADDEIDSLEAEVQSTAMAILSRFEPVAADLRIAVTSLRLASALERVGDECVSIARRAKQLNAAPQVAATRMLEPLLDNTLALFHEALAAMATRRLESAAAIAPHDVDLDLLCANVTDKLTTAVERGTLDGPACATLALIARSLEHIGDQAKELAALTLYRLDPQVMPHTL